MKTEAQAEEKPGARKFLGDALNIFNVRSAFLVGILILLMGVGDQHYVVSGIIVLLGATACTLALKRKALKSSSALRFVLELILITLVVLFVFFTGKESMIEDPILYLVIPAWTLIAYVLTVNQKQKSYIDTRKNVPEYKNMIQILDEVTGHGEITRK